MRAGTGGGNSETPPLSGDGGGAAGLSEPLPTDAADA